MASPNESLKGAAKGAAPPTYEPSSTGQAMEDAKALREAISHFRADKKTLIRIIPAISVDPQRMALVQETYTQLYQRQLEDDIRGHLSYFRDVMARMIKGPIWSDVERLGQIVFESAEDVRHFLLSEIIFHRSHAQLQELAALYEQERSRPLADYIKSCCTGSPRTAQLLVKYLLETERCEDGSDALDTESIRSDTQLLHQGIWRQGEDLDYVMDILVRSSRERLIALMDQFAAVYTVSLTSYIKDRITDGDQRTVVRFLEWAEDPVLFSANRLAKLWPIKNRAAVLRNVTHTMLWAHWNRALFEAGKMKLRYHGQFLRNELQRGLLDEHYRELMLKICDGDY